MGAPSCRHHILTLRLPGNVERVVNDLRSAFYSLTGAVSTQALPPVLPLAYVPRDTRAEAVGRLPQTEITPLHVGPVGTHGETLVLTVEMEDLWYEWLRGFVGKPGPRGMPAPFAGIFLGGPDLLGSPNLVNHRAGSSNRDDWWSLVDQSISLPKRLSVLHVELMSLQTQAPDAWWDHLDWEILWSKRIKLRG